MIKQWFKERTIWEFFAYIISFILIVGIIVFFIGFFLTTKIESPIGNYNLSVNLILSNKTIINNSIGVDTKNLFTLYQTFDIDNFNNIVLIQKNVKNIKSLIDCSIAGFSLIIISISLFLLIIIFNFISNQFNKWKESKIKKNK